MCVLVTNNGTTVLIAMLYNTYIVSYVHYFKYLNHNMCNVELKHYMQNGCSTSGRVLFATFDY